MIPQAGIFVCLMLAGTACLVVWLLERGELGEEEERRTSGGEEVMSVEEGGCRTGSTVCSMVGRKETG